MKKTLMTLMVLTVGLFLSSCASQGYNTQKGAAIGAGLGAIAGQAIGRNTSSTLIGAAVGGLAGVVGGNAVDQHVAGQPTTGSRQPVATAFGYPGTEISPQDNPPGQWVEVPGQWVGGKWVPTHKVWVPVNP